MLKSCCTNWGSKGGGSHEQREKCNKRISKVSKGKDYFENVFIHKFDSITTIGLLLTLARRKILCKRYSTKSRMALESRADSGLNPLFAESHGGQNDMRAGTA